MKTQAIVLFLLLAPSIAEANASCATLRLRLEELITHSECRQSADCAVVQLPPPFGCNIYLNKRYVAAVEETRQDFVQHCESAAFQCLQPADHVHCRSGRCVGKVYLDRRAPNNGSLNRHGRPLDQR